MVALYGYIGRGLVRDLPNNGPLLGEPVSIIQLLRVSKVGLKAIRLSDLSRHYKAWFCIRPAPLGWQTDCVEMDLYWGKL